jgi:hypothetical protein
LERHAGACTIGRWKTVLPSFCFIMKRYLGLGRRVGWCAGCSWATPGLRWPALVSLLSLSFFFFYFVFVLNSIFNSILIAFSILQVFLIWIIQGIAQDSTNTLVMY